MPPVEQAIILTAGRADQADGMVKASIRHPVTGKTILQHAIEAFAGKRITAVVGYRAIQVMEAHPTIEYVINHDWAITNNAMSVSLALTNAPTYVVSGDIFFERSLIEYLDGQAEDLVLTDARENRSLTAVHCVLRDDGSVASTYQGPIRDIAHPEAIGLFKISNAHLLHTWKRLSTRHANLFVGQTLPCDGAPVSAVPRQGHMFDEINTAADYLRLIERTRRR